MLFQNIAIALSSLWRNKIRSILTMFAVVMGMSSFILITAVVDGLKESVSGQINEFGADLLVVNPGNLITRDESGESTGVNFEGLGAAFGASTLTPDDLTSIEELDSTDHVTPQAIVSDRVQIDGTDYANLFVFGTGSEFADIANMDLSHGQFFTDDAASNQVVISDDLALRFFGIQDASVLGREITVRQEVFEVSGVLETPDTSGSPFGGAFGTMVLMSFDAALELADGNVQLSEIDLRPAEGYDVDQTLQEVRAVLLENHDGIEDFTVAKQEELLEVSVGIFDTIKEAARVISYLLLFVGGVVVALIMYISVTERIREIGLRKSVGATNGQIMIQFMTEAVVIALVGSLVGIGIGWLIGLAMPSLIDITPAYTLNAFILAITISVFVGVISGLFPAVKAARQNPIEALRYE